MKVKHKKAYQKFIPLLMAFLLVCLFVVPENKSYARATFASRYMQTVYNQNNGIGSNEVNCLYQSSSGYIWLGTDGGLYRSSGTDFQSINLWDTDRSDVYSINCIMQDDSGRMWIGTDNYGLFCIEKGNPYHFSDEYYNGVKSIYGIEQLEDGKIYVSTCTGIYYIDKKEDGGMCLTIHPDEKAIGNKFGRMVSYKGNLWVVRGDNEIYILNEDSVSFVIDTTKNSSDDIRSISCIGDDVYIGTSGNEILVYKNRANCKVLDTSVDGINRIMADSTSRIWVCADNGVGYYNSDFVFNKVNDLKIDNYVSDMIEDYEGNYWLSSSKMGMLYLAKSKFVDYNLVMGMPETIVNCVYVNGKEQYIGTDDGLYIYGEEGTRIDNELTSMLSGISVRDIYKDSVGNLWIATFRKCGVVRVGTDGTISSIGRNEKMPSMAVKKLMELDNGYIAAATDEGIAVIDRTGMVCEIYGKEYGIGNSQINCMYQDENGNILVGTDGEGIISIDKNQGKYEKYNMDDGLNSNVVTDFEEGSEGLWIGTDNGLCYYSDAFRTVSFVDYSNSVYDILVDEKTVWIIGSKGILHATEDELLGSQSAAERYLDKNDGLTRELNTTGDSTMDAEGLLYICCNSGLYTIATDDIPYNTTEPKISVTSVDVDGKRYEFDDLADGLTVGSDASRITVKFAVFSYENRKNIEVQYSLEGFDESPIVLTGEDAMEAVYTNLDGGSYEFTLSATNGDGKEAAEKLSFMIEKQKSFFEKPAARLLLLLIILVAVAAAVYALYNAKKLLKSKNSALEKLSKEHEEAIKSSSAKNDYLANMSNEIKTPINIMMVKAEELLGLMGQDVPYRSDVETIYETGNDIIAKVDDIILLAKIEAGKLEVVKQTYSISELMYELSEYATQLIGDKSIKFFIELGELQIDNVIGDKEKIKEILSRIIDNAVKYTREGSITFSVDGYEYEDKNHNGMLNIVFSVADTGIGIQEERLESIFEIYDVEENRKNGYKAENGIGLAIAKGYAELIDGELQADSVYGAGSTFTLSINQKTVEKTTRKVEFAKIDETVSKEEAEKLWLPEVSLLLVDDDERSLEVEKKTLARFEMKIDVATSGISAIDMIMNNDYDVVFMDLTLPIMNGIDTMKEIREIDEIRFSTMPIISMDTDAIETNKASLLEAGFTDSMVKPIDVRRVAAILKDCLPQSKIQEKSDDISEYIKESRFGEGLKLLEKCIDVKTVIEKIGGSIDMFNKLIIAYYNQNYIAEDDIKEKFQKDMRGFKVRIHNIKTGSSNIGAYRLAQKTSKIEAAINIGNKEYIRDNLSDFLSEFDLVLQVLAEYIDFLDGVSGMTDEEYAEQMNAKHNENKYEANSNSKPEKRENIEEKNEQNKAGETEDTINDKNVTLMDGIDADMLETIKCAAEEADFDMAKQYYDMLMTRTYNGEDAEFLAALNESISNKDVLAVSELVNTYIDLKL